MGRPLYLAAGTALDVDAFALVDAAGAAGFAGVGLRLSHEHAVTAGARRELMSWCRRAGVAVHDVEVQRIGTSDGHGALLDAAAALGARWVLAVSDLPDDADGRDTTRRHLRRLVDDAASVGVGVGLEYMAWTTPRSSGVAVEMAHDTGARVVVDVLHHHRLGEGAAALDAVCRSGVLGWVQVCDAPWEAPADLLDEARHRRLLPGAGELPLAELLAVVPAEVALSVEVQSDHLVAVAPVLERAALAFAATAAVVGVTG